MRSLICSTLILSLILLAFPMGLLAQQDQSKTETSKQKADQPIDFSKAISESNAKVAREAASFDPVKLERENAKQKRSDAFSRNEKIVIAALIVGVIALVVLAVKYGKKCIRYYPAGCDPVTEEGCICEEYEQNR